MSNRSSFFVKSKCISSLFTSNPYLFYKTNYNRLHVVSSNKYNMKKQFSIKVMYNLSLYCIEKILFQYSIQTTCQYFEWTKTLFTYKICTVCPYIVWTKTNLPNNIQTTCQYILWKKLYVHTTYQQVVHMLYGQTFLSIQHIDNFLYFV